LVKPGDAHALAEGISTLISHKPLRQQCEIRARKRALQKYNWSIVTDNLLQAYDYAVTDAKRGYS